MSQKIELQEKLEARLEQKQNQQQTLSITLGQYLEQENIIKGFIRYANEHNCWKEFDKDGFKFTYIALPYNVAGGVADEWGPGFYHCMYDPFFQLVTGSFIKFVIPEMIPLDFVDFVAIHERGEELSLGNHYFASQLEFAYVNKKHKVTPYVKFIDDKYPFKFVDLTEKITFPILPRELIDILEMHKNEDIKELNTAERMINNNPIPTSVLKKMDYYEQATEEADEILHEALGLTQAELYDRTVKEPKPTVDELADIVNKRLTTSLALIPPIKARGISSGRIDQILQLYSSQISNDVNKQVNRNLNIPEDFKYAYLKMRNKERLVHVNRTVEDDSRRLI